MKRIFCFIITMIIVFSLCGCNNFQTKPQGDNNSKPTEQIIENLLYEKDIEKIKNIYKNKIEIEGSGEIYRLCVSETISDVNGKFIYQIENEKITDSSFHGEDISYFTEDIITPQTQYEDFIKLEKNNMDYVEKKLKNAYNAYTEYFNVTSFDVTCISLAGDRIIRSKLSSYEDFYSYVSRMFDTDTLGTDTNQLCQMEFQGFDNNTGRAIEIRFYHFNYGLSYIIKELPTE